MSYHIVPESAPFSAEQRAWLNGFFAGVLGALDAGNPRGGTTVALDAAAALLPPSSGSPTPTANDENFPWHDASLLPGERMALAEGKPIERRMMAAMAQLDCGSCGYLCKSYAEAIATGKEKNLTLCTPGGSETAKLLRTLNRQRDSNRSAPSAAATDEPPARGTRGNPATAHLISSARLNGSGSAKDTRHVVIDLGDSGVTYQVGDALGVLPLNCGALIQDVCQAAAVNPASSVRSGDSSLPLETVLQTRCLRSISIELCELARRRVQQRPRLNGDVSLDSHLANRLEAFVESESIDEWDVCEFLKQFSPLGLTAQDLVDTLAPLRPRLYSIASSQRVFPTQVHLTVGRVENEIRGRARKGVASTMLTDRLEPGAPIQIFVQPNHGFTVPAELGASIIMIGPGTGIAPFIAFLQQRASARASHAAVGGNWLFFGDQTRAADFLYEEQLTEWLESGLLSRLDLAFSRDGDQKVYVQNRMREQGAELFRWLETGSYLYICGDAKRMARDVEQALIEIIAEHGNRSDASAKEYVKMLRQAKRFASDVY